MDFRGKIGPLPAWAWGLGIGAIFVVWLWANKQSASTEPAPTTESTPVSSNFGTPVYVTPPDDVNAKTTADPTNQEWLVQAVNAVSNNSTTSRLTAQSVLERYLYGDTALSASDQAIVNIALNKVGLPPEGTYSSPTLDKVKTPEEIAAEKAAAKTSAAAKAAQAIKDAAAKAAADKAVALKNKKRPVTKDARYFHRTQDGIIYRIEYDGSITPISTPTWSAARLRGALSGYNPEMRPEMDPARYPQNPMI